MAVTRHGRANETRSFESYLSVERSRIFDRASKERKEQMRAAEAVRSVYAAWNTVVAGTREASHVTGLRYLPESNELLVYLDAPAWTQEMVLMREIIRGRMERAGVKIAGLKFRTTRAGYAPKKRPGIKESAPARNPSPLPPLPEEKKREIEASVSGIADKKLREALQNAMKAGAQLNNSKDGHK